MFQFEADKDVIVKQSQVLEQALSTNPKTQQALQKRIREAVMEARAEVVSSITFKHGDPRGAARAVRSSVYKKILGANINIFNSRKAHGTTSYEPPRTLQSGQRGGNRVPRGPRTAQIMSYSGLDRGFILRFLNAGAGTGEERQAGTRGGRLSGARGRIAPSNFFRPAGERALAQAAQNLATMIEEQLAEIMRTD